MKYKKLLFLIFILVLLNSFVVNVYAQEKLVPEIESSNVILIETDRGQIIYAKRSEEKIDSQIAVIVMTAITAIETQNKPPVITISTILEETIHRSVDISIGEKYPFIDLLNVLLLTNAPDIALVLGDSLYSDLNSFIEKMNEKASALDLKDTELFIDTTERLQIKCITTLDDLSKLLQYCLKNMTFKNIFTSRIFLWHKSEEKSEIISNSNDLIWKYNNITGGIKSTLATSTTSSVVTTSSINNLNLLCIISSDQKGLMDTETNELIQYASDNYRRGILASNNQPLTDITVNDTILALSPNTDIYYTYPIGQSFIEKVTYSLPDDLALPIYKNVSVAVATFHLVDGTIINVSLYPNNDILENITFFDRIKDKLSQEKDLTNVIIILLILEIIIIIYKVIKRIQK